MREAELQLCALSLAQTEYVLALARQAGLPPTSTLGDAVEAGWSRLEKRPDVQPNPNAIGGDKTPSPSR
jgi:hypothetical protein